MDGLCLTEHHSLWNPHDVDQLIKNEDIKIFRGNEITTNQGDILIFGYEGEIPDVITIQELHQRVKEVEGLMIAAHPFRGFLLFGIGQLQMTVDKACERRVFQYVDAVEIKNNKLNDDENNMAYQVSQRLGLPGTAGSDAHRIDEIGKCITIFERDVQNERELIQEICAGRFEISSAR